MVNSTRALYHAARHRIGMHDSERDTIALGVACLLGSRSAMRTNIVSALQHFGFSPLDAEDIIRHGIVHGILTEREVSGVAYLWAGSPKP